MRWICPAVLTVLLLSLQPVFATEAPPCSGAVCAADVSFANGDVRLSGTLYRPGNGRIVSALVAAHGASGGERSSAMFRHLYEALPRLGVAVLVFDRRGAGRSTGVLKDADYTVLADDAIAARRFIASQPGLGDVPVGYWGYSQGGWIATLAGSRDPQAAFVVSVSAPLVPADVQMIEATRNILRIHDVSEDDIAIAIDARKAVDAHIRGQMNAAQAQAKLDLSRSKPWFGLIYMSGKLGDPKTSRWLKEISNDPLRALTKVRAPALLVFGRQDVWIPVPISVERAEALANERLAVVVIDDADHAMMTTLSPMQQIDTRMSKQYRPDSVEYFYALASWLTKNGFAGLE